MGNVAPALHGDPPRFRFHMEAEHRGLNRMMAPTAARKRQPPTNRTDDGPEPSSGVHGNSYSAI